ncbi:MAG: hypothetical protein Q7K40_00430 [bacterium]|nr:hypothetical protein [bacterium]
MNKKIKLFVASLVVVAWVFGGTGIASAQTTTATCNSATLQGTLTSTGGATTTVWFEWATSAATVDAGSGTKTATQTFNSPQSFSQNISGLNQNTTYYYRAVFSNVNGSTNGTTRSFATSTCGSSGGGDSSSTTIGTCRSATVHGNLTSTGGATTTVWFEWSTSSGSVSSGVGARTNSQIFNSPQSFSELLSNLSPSTTYYYRAVFSNNYGTTNGSVRSFTTASCSNPPSQTGSQPSVTTNSASSVSQNMATLNGYVTPNGSNANTWFEWGTSYGSLNNTTSVLNYGTSGTSFNNQISGLNTNTTYYFRAVAQNSYGTVYGNTLSFTTTGQSYNYTQPYVTTNAATSILQNTAMLNGYVYSGYSNINTWFEWGTSYSLGNTTSSAYNYGTSGASFNTQLSGLNSNTTYYFRAVAQGTNGLVYGSTLSFTTTGQMYVPLPIYYGVAPTATTLLATELTGNTAKLNGLVATTNSQASSAWYEWGTTGSLGYKTQVVNVGALPVVKHSDFLTGLVNGQTYYYRIVAQNSSGTSYGTVNSFVSEENTYVAPPTRTVIVQRPITTVITRGSSAESLVTLSIEGGAEMIGQGEKRTYHVKWKNESTQSLKNVVLQVTFPASMTIDSATRGAFSRIDNSVVVDLKTLDSKEEGETFIFATSGRVVKSGETLVVIANMVYTGTNGVQGDAVAYVMHRTEVMQNMLGASVLGAGDFVPTTLFEWLLLLILILVLVLLGNHLYGRFSGDRRH